MYNAGESLLRALGKLSEEDNTVVSLCALWPLLVGRLLAQHTRPVALAGGRLEVLVDSPVWLHQLQDLSPEIRGRLNRFCKNMHVAEVRFRKCSSPLSVPMARNQNESAPAVMPSVGFQTDTDLLSAHVTDPEIRFLLDSMAAAYFVKPAEP